MFPLFSTRKVAWSFPFTFKRDFLETSYKWHRRSLLFIVPYFPARLDFPSPPLSAPGSPRMCKWYTTVVFKETQLNYQLAGWLRTSPTLVSRHPPVPPTSPTKPPTDPNKKPEDSGLFTLDHSGYRIRDSWREFTDGDHLLAGKWTKRGGS